MRRVSAMSAITALLVAAASICFAATNLNSSKSNIYRLAYPADGMTSAQADALVAGLDKLGRGADEAAEIGRAHV